MKKLFISLAWCLLMNITGAQEFRKEKFDAASFPKLVPANLSLVATRNLCELNELVQVFVRITVAPEGGAPATWNYEFADEQKAPWKISSFKIISGDAAIALTDGSMAQLKMPAKMPAGKAVQVQAILDPVTRGEPQVQLFTTIYLEDNLNVFYFHCPAYSVNNEKYVIEKDNGIETKLDAVQQKSTGNSNVPADLQHKLLQKRVDMGIVTSMDVGVLTANARAIYVKEQNLTTITLQGEKITMVNGRPSTGKRKFMINLSFPGAEKGSFSLKAKKEITVAIVFPLTGQSCACSDDPEEKKRRDEAGEQGPTCSGGTINITRYDRQKKTVEGYFRTYLEGLDGSQVIYGILEGKFAVPLAEIGN